MVEAHRSILERRLVLDRWLGAWCDMWKDHYEQFTKAQSQTAAWHQCAAHCAHLLAMLADANVKRHEHQGDIKKLELPPLRAGPKLDIERMIRQLILAHLRSARTDAWLDTSKKQAVSETAGSLLMAALDKVDLPIACPRWSQKAVESLATAKGWKADAIQDNLRKDRVQKTIQMLEVRPRENIYRQVIDFVASYHQSCSFTSWVMPPLQATWMSNGREVAKNDPEQEKRELCQKIMALKSYL